MEILEEERAKDVTCWLKVIKLRNQEAHGQVANLVKFLGDWEACLKRPEGLVNIKEQVSGWEAVYSRRVKGCVLRFKIFKSRTEVGPNKSKI